MTEAITATPVFLKAGVVFIYSSEKFYMKGEKTDD